VQDVVQPYTNRDPARLTQLIMTGVTAMSRVTAVRMDQKGYDYPAQVISDVFAAADITHISNEVPFLDDCVANPAENNLILCSDTDYWAALDALGTDIVGLSGNHVNDFGRDGGAAFADLVSRQRHSDLRQRLRRQRSLRAAAVGGSRQHLRLYRRACLLPGECLGHNRAARRLLLL
jgi:hypothetical protein